MTTEQYDKLAKIPNEWELQRQFKHIGLGGEKYSRVREAWKKVQEREGKLWMQRVEESKLGKEW